MTLPLTALLLGLDLAAMVVLECCCAERRVCVRL